MIIIPFRLGGLFGIIAIGIMIRSTGQRRMEDNQVVVGKSSQLACSCSHSPGADPSGCAFTMRGRTHCG